MVRVQSPTSACYTQWPNPLCFRPICPRRPIPQLPLLAPFQPMSHPGLHPTYSPGVGTHRCCVLPLCWNTQVMGGFLFFLTHHLFYCHPTPLTPPHLPFASALDCLQVVRLLCQTIEVSPETLLDQSPTGRLLRGRRTTLTERPWLFLSLSKPRGHSFV